MIKGYIRYFNNEVPITWERESQWFVFDVRKIIVQNNTLIISDRLFDDKIPKNEITVR